MTLQTPRFTRGCLNAPGEPGAAGTRRFGNHTDPGRGANIVDGVRRGNMLTLNPPGTGLIAGPTPRLAAGSGGSWQKRRRCHAPVLLLMEGDVGASGWIGVDLDGTLAIYDGWKDGAIGEPVPEMLFRVRKWLADGVTVKVMTARASVPEEREKVVAWLASHELDCDVTDRKDFAMIELWDDRAVAVEPNTGRVLGGGRR